MLATNSPAGWMRSALRGDLAGRAFDDRDALGVGQKRPDVKPGRRLVHAEKGERIAVAGVDDRLDLGGSGRRGIARPPLRPPALASTRRMPCSGIATQPGRLASS